MLELGANTLALFRHCSQTRRRAHAACQKLRAPAGARSDDHRLFRFSVCTGQFREAPIGNTFREDGALIAIERALLPSDGFLNLSNRDSKYRQTQAVPASACEWPPVPKPAIPSPFGPAAPPLGTAAEQEDLLRVRSRDSHQR